MAPLLSHKELLFESFISKNVLNESYHYEGKVSFIELLLEAPIDKSTVDKMLSSGKRSSIYYQGDDNISKGWHTVEPVKSVKSGGIEYLSAYDVPKGDEKNSKLVNFDQKKIVNWNVLSSKSADLAKAYKAKNKISNYFSTSGISSKVSDFKDKMKQKLKDIGVKAGNKLKKAAVATAIAGSVLMPFQSSIKQYLRKQAPHVAQLYSTKSLTQNDYRDSELKMMGMLISNAIKDGQTYGQKGKYKSDESKGAVTYNQYRSDVRKDLYAGDMMNPKEIFNQVTKDPEVLVALTLGKFAYQKNDDSSYTVTDTYDFSKWKDINTTKEDLKGLSYPEAISKIRKDSGTNLYGAIRHMAYLENPDDVPGVEGKKVKITIPAKYVTDYDLDSFGPGTD